MKAFRLTLALAIAVAGCADLETVTPPSIVVDGPTTVQLGQTVTLTASTRNGSDPGYTFESSDPATATVGENGVVKGLALGQADIKVTGKDTKAVTTHPVVVVAGDTSSLPNFAAWSTSPHADASSEVFNHWNAEGQVPVECAKCHTQGGYIQYLGDAGTPAGVVTNPVPVGSVIDCKTCHTASANTLSSVTFPSGTVISGLGNEARCMVCHQGRAAGADVTTAITNYAVATDDTVSSTLAFVNVHNAAAAAILEGGRVAGGYQYPTLKYDVRFRHVPGVDNCVACHDAHSTKINLDTCATCHTGVTDQASLLGIRAMSSAAIDYDGDGDVTEGIAGEISTLRALLLATMQRYATEHAAALCYTSAEPNWFVDTNGNGLCDLDETTQFASWTPRLMRAGYNYQLAVLGSFAHNAKYIIELLYDSIMDVNAKLATPFVTSALVRTDYGHFNGAGNAARNWDTAATPGVPAGTNACSRCHSASVGFRFFTQFGVPQVVSETGNGLDCVTCHDSVVADAAKAEAIPGAETLYAPLTVYLPTTSNGGPFIAMTTAQLTNAGFDGPDRVCANCHIGRSNGTIAMGTINAAAQTAAAAGTLMTLTSLPNAHHDVAAGTRGGGLLHMGAEYAGQAYTGLLQHPPGNACTLCHDPVATKHTFSVADINANTNNFQKCKNCHSAATAPREITLTSNGIDYDGNGLVQSFAVELDGVAARLVDAMRTFASTAGRTSPCYSSTISPFLFMDNTSHSAVCNATDAISTNAYTRYSVTSGSVTTQYGWWDPRLAQAAYNYTLMKTGTDAGAYAHNFRYMAQLLNDGIDDLLGAGSAAAMGLTRPTLVPTTPP